MRSIIIGDVHGCLQELQTLLHLIRPLPTDELIFVGDLVDKGPQSAEVVKLVRRLPEILGCSRVLVKGNHEEIHERWIQHREAGDGVERKMRCHEEILQIQAGLDEADRKFLLSGLLYYQPQARQDCLVVHGGIPASMTQLPDLVAYQQMTRNKRKTIDLMLRTRYVKPDGGFVQLGDKLPEDKLWAEYYDGRFGHVYFGHEAFVPTKHELYGNFHNHVRFPYATATDWGCVFGGALAAHILEAGAPVEYRYATARQKYCDRIEE